MNQTAPLPFWVKSNLQAIEHGLNQTESIANMIGLRDDILNHEMRDVRKHSIIVYNKLVEVTNKRYDNIANSLGFFQVTI